MDELADYYARRAPEYERIYDKPERQEDLQVLKAFLTKTFAGSRALEVACGTGWWTQLLARSAMSVVATDINEEVLTIARAKPIEPGRVTFVRADAFQLDSVPGEFNAALSAFWWSHLTRDGLSQFLSRLHQRLEPGSEVVFIDNNFVAGSSTAISRRDLEGNTYQLRTLADGSTTEVLKNFPTDKEIQEALRGAVTDLCVQRLTYYWLASYRVGG